MKKKKVNKNENEWKGILQNSANLKVELSEGHTPISRNVSVKIPAKFNGKLPSQSFKEEIEATKEGYQQAVPNYTKHLSGWKDMIEHKMFENDIFKKEVELDNQEELIGFNEGIEYTFQYGNQTIKTKENSVDFYQVGESNVSTESVTSTNVKSYEEKYLDLQEHLKTNPDKPFIWGTPGSDYDADLNELTKKWKDYSKDKTLSGEEEHCNVGVNKDWENSDNSKNLKKIYEFLESDYFTPTKKDKKEKRIDFEFTPFTFWQLIPSIAINLHCNEIELTWLCFGMYIKFK